MSAHTPAPWEATPVSDYGTITILGRDKSGDFLVAEIQCGELPAADVANARLIAAAPELLEALVQVMKWIRNWSPEFTEDEEWGEDETAALAAIAKAKGQPAEQGSSS